ncbi:uncharacterized protein LOC129938798 [Eupeodes corollae]|uniref:uncharacterized protein LOC129938798 n=1 Tax=Eupeodes corollae TaxID=290404 RepID=UPI002490A9F2|nr:uncharacterized protein LOC129938798 [Eupeodes corollae]
MDNKVFILLLVFISIQVYFIESLKLQDGLRSLSDDGVKQNCREKENVTTVEFSNFDFDINIIRKSVEKNPKEKCYIVCVLEHGQLMNGCEVLVDNFFDLEKESVKKSEEFIQFNKIKEILKNKTDRCECGFMLLDLLFTENV